MDRDKRILRAQLKAQGLWEDRPPIPARARLNLPLPDPYTTEFWTNTIRALLDDIDRLRGLADVDTFRVHYLMYRSIRRVDGAISMAPKAANPIPYKPLWRPSDLS